MNANEKLKKLLAYKLMQKQKDQGINGTEDYSGSVNRESIDRIMQDIRPGGSNGNGSMLDNFLGGLHDLTVHNLRGSDHPIPKSLGMGQQTNQERIASESKNRMEVMDFLQKQHEAKQRREFEKLKLDEDIRHHDQQNKYWQAVGSRESSAAAKERREIEQMDHWKKENAELQETDPGALYLEPMATSTQNIHLKRDHEAIEGARETTKAIEEIEDLMELVKNSPIVSKYSQDLYNPEKDDFSGKIGALKEAWMSKKDKRDIDLYRKHTNSLISNSIAAMKGIRHNMFTEKTIAKSIARAGMNKDAQLELYSKMKKHMKAQESAQKKIMSNISRGITNPRSIYGDYPDQNEQVDTAGNGNNSGDKKKQLNDASVNKSNNSAPSFRGGSINIMLPNGTVQAIPKNTPEELLKAIIESGGAIK